MEKRCFKCGDVRPLDDFYSHPQMGDGHLNKCKPCTRKDAREHRLANPEKVRERERTKKRTPASRDRASRYLREWQAAHPERREAHIVVGNAIRDGRLAKQPCAFCGTPEPVEAHHHDYAKPLDVTWLCKPCHRRFHALERMATYRQDEAPLTRETRS
jgi:hypothetical protein